VVALSGAVPEGDASKDGAARLYQRAGHEEWAADLTLTGKAEGATTPVKLRLGLVLVGHVSG
jgi:hypothetical protein